MVNLANPADRNSLSFRFRSHRDVGLREFLLAARGGKGRKCRIADLGGSAGYWERVGFDWLEENGFAVACVNNEPSELRRGSDGGGPIEYILADACRMEDFADDSFEIVHSNSVIEHVGGWPEIAGFAAVVRRLAPSYYVQTPYFWFPVDPHFYRFPALHWLPVAARAQVHRRMKAGWAPRATDRDAAMRLAESNFMLDRKQFRALFPDAEHSFERFAGLPKSMIATRLAPDDETQRN